MTAERAPAAFAADVVALVPRLRAYARTLARDPNLADDLVQDTVVLALQAWESFTPGTNLMGWLFTIERNRFRSLIGRRHVAAEVRDDDLEHRAAVPAFQEGQAELRDFKAAFARLGPSRREMLVLNAVHGLPYEQVAAVTGCPVGTVKSRINRARAALRAMLLGEDAPEGHGRERRPRAGVERPERPAAS
jgi:RNA polymerase sigma-70 factor (ECF subfamily)